MDPCTRLDRARVHSRFGLLWVNGPLHTSERVNGPFTFRWGRDRGRHRAIRLHWPALSSNSDSVVRLTTGLNQSIHSLVGYPQITRDSA